MWKLQQAMQDDAIRTTTTHPAVHPSKRVEVFIWPISSPLGEISGTKPAHPFIWTHQKFYKGFRSKARSWKPGQPGQPGSYEVGLINVIAQTDIFRLNSTVQNQIYPLTCLDLFRQVISTTHFKAHIVFSLQNKVELFVNRLDSVEAVIPYEYSRYWFTWMSLFVVYQSCINEDENPSCSKHPLPYASIPSEKLACWIHFKYPTPILLGGLSSEDNLLTWGWFWP